MRLTPGIELKTFWGSQAAATNGRFNLAGIADPVVDALVDKIVAAKTRDELVTATRAADRVLKAGHYWVPQWYKGAHNLAFWNKFGWPDVKPKYARGASRRHGGMTVRKRVRCRNGKASLAASD